MRESFWTDERVELLRQGAADGLLAGAIALKIGDGCNRNKVIGKARREAIKLRGPVYASAKKRGQPRYKGITRRLRALRKPAQRLESTLKNLRDDLAALEARLAHVQDMLAVIDQRVAA